MTARVIVIGGGAAGVFAAIAAKAKNPSTQVILLEKSAVLLSKVRISGGGRCNVTHACFDPKLLVLNYPRGGKELLGPFHRFQPRDTIDWFESRGVLLKEERDGRMFPITDRSETIIHSLLAEAEKLGVEILLRQRIETITRKDGGFELTMKESSCLQYGLQYGLQCERLILATGSSQDGFGWAKNLGHTIQEPVPSLFTFNVPSSPLKELSGIAIEQAELKIAETPFLQKGALLITHFGFSGPAALKLSAWAARALHEKEYRATLVINWLPDLGEDEILNCFLELKAKHPGQNPISENPFKFPKNFWKLLLGKTFDRRMSAVPLKDLHILARKLHADRYEVEGKTTNKEEFVTCGGITLKEVDFKTMESKVCPGLFFAGEILDIDGVTGGFNFQNAWTTGFISGSA